MPLPNLFLLGAARSGTTALAAALGQHPEVYMSPVKEPGFFALDHHSAPPPWPLGPPQRTIWDPPTYLQLFSGVGDEPVIAEASVIYLASERAAAGIGENLPEAKLVAVLRDPVARAYAQYGLFVRSGREPAASFERALALEDERIAAGWFSAWAYRGRGLYHAQLRRYYDRFAPEQIRIYLYEDWRESPAGLLRDLFGWLGVEPGFQPELAEHNATRVPRSRTVQRMVRRVGDARLSRVEERLNSRTPPPMRADTRRRLRASYRDDILALQTLIGRDLSGWLDESR